MSPTFFWKIKVQSTLLNASGVSTINRTDVSRACSVKLLYTSTWLLHSLETCHSPFAPEFDHVRWLIEVESCSIYYLRSHFVSLNTVLKVHRCYGMWQYFIMSSAWMKFHYICATFCLFIILSLSIKVLSLDYCKGCNTLESVDSSWRCWFQFFSESSPM